MVKVEVRKAIVIVLGCILAAECTSEDSPVVHTKNGSVRGFVQQSSKGKAIYSFMSIPYAAPPIGKLRFKPPQPAPKWDQVLDGTSPPPACIQFDNFVIKGVTRKEDCLYLNIYSKELPDNVHNPKLPVMIWIHGGGFTIGSSSQDMYNPTFLLDKDIVMVSINYRLGPFGFMSTADQVIQGNMGLKDQSLALRWVKENIADFGGDPERITIFGESAGSASVHYHLLSPMSRGLFHRAIAQSGTAMDKWAFMEPQEIASRSRRLSSWLNCPTENSQDMLTCLQDLDAHKVAEMMPRYLEWFIFPIAPFSPTREVGGDDRFMDKSPEESLQMGLVADVPFLCGHTDSEGEFFAVAILKEDLLKDVNEKYLEIFPTLLMYKHIVTNPDEYSQRIREYFFGNQEISKKTLPEFIKMFSDAFVNFWGYTAIRLHQAALVNSHVYYYRLAFMGSISVSNAPFMGLPSYKPIGVAHADDLLYLFKTPFVPPFKEGSPEDKMSNKIISWWVNFASTGNPTPDGGKESDVIWEPLEAHHFNHFNMTLTPKMQTDFFYERLAFWRTLYDDMAASQVKTKDEL